MQTLQTTVTRRPRHLPAWLVAAVVTALLAAMTWQAVARIPAVAEPPPLVVWSDCSGVVMQK